VEQIRRRVQSGFTLIELLITVAVMAILMKLSSPMYTSWVGNQEIRAGAESIIGAINIARHEAMKRNGRVLFQLTDSVGFSTSWRVCPVARGTTVCDANFPDIQIRDGDDESRRATVGASTNVATTNPGAFTTSVPVGGIPSGVLFDGLGRPVAASTFVSLARVDVRNTNLDPADERRLVVVISSAGGARACDPNPATPISRRC
jgi:type IV fimbrial biogenesis protein FimT